jgi:hypothetical protein
MFIVSQMLLQKLNMCHSSSIPVYSIAVGLVFYACVYLYLIFYNNDYVYIFNKFVIYIVGIDLLLSAFVYMKNENSAPNAHALVQDEDETALEVTTDDNEVESIYTSEGEHDDEGEHDENDEDVDVDVDQEIESFSEQLRRNSEPLINEEATLVEPQPKKRRGRPPKTLQQAM